MRHVDAGGAQLATVVLGAGPRLVFVHGLAPGSMATWYFTLALPLAEHFRVLLYDLRGHGDSTMPVTGYDLDTQADDLRAIVSHDGEFTTPVDLVGHSWGALIALRFALRYRTCVRRLVLVDTPLQIEPLLLARGGFDGTALDAYLDMQFSGRTRPRGRRLERLHERLVALFTTTTLPSDLATIVRPSDAALATLDAPTLLVNGRHSPWSATGAYLAARLPNSALRELDAGHDIPSAAPAELRELVAQFLRGM